MEVTVIPYPNENFDYVSSPLDLCTYSNETLYIHDM